MQKTGDILLQFYKDVWTARNLDSLEQFFENNSQTAPRIPARAIDLKEIREWMEIFHSVVTNIDVSLVQMVEDGAWACALLEVTCNDIDTDKPVKVWQTVMARQENGRLAESYPQFDFLRFFQQLGRLPPDSYELLMGGHTLS